jgi:hypothetical protein
MTVDGDIQTVNSGTQVVGGGTFATTDDTI